MYQMKALRLVTFTGNLKEYILVAKDPTYLDKILPFIISLSPEIEQKKQTYM